MNIPFADSQLVNEEDKDSVANVNLFANLYVDDSQNTVVEVIKDGSTDVCEFKAFLKYVTEKIKQ